MSLLSGYRINETIHRGALTVIYRAQRQKDGLPVVLKTLRSEYPSQGEISRLRLEYENASQFDDDAIIKVLDFREQGASAILVLEDFGGFSNLKDATEEVRKV